MYCTFRMFKFYAKQKINLTWPEVWNYCMSYHIFLLPLTLRMGGGGGEGGVLFFKVWIKGGVMKKLLRNREFSRKGGVSKLLHQFSFRKACFNYYWNTFFLFFFLSIFTLAVINRSILSCGLLSTRKWYIMEFLFLLLLFLNLFLWKFYY